MKKSLIALAALAAVSAASAQSTVTISGTFGAGYQSYQLGAIDGKAATTGATTAGAITASTLGTATAAASTAKGLVPVTDSSIKFTMSEDLGGGLKAIAAGQFQLNGDRGGSLTKEDSSVTLSGGFGSIAIANTRSGDTAINAGVFASWMPVTSWYDTIAPTRSNIDILSYTSPAISGFTLGVSITELTQNANTAASVNKVNTISGTYSNGPLTVMAAHKNTTGTVTSTTKRNNTEFAATYDFGVAKIGFGSDGAITTGAGAYSDSSAMAYGISVPVGAITVGVNGAKRGVNKFVEGGVNYALSKRSTLALMYGDMTNSSNASTTSQSKAGAQYRIGLKHTF